MPGRVYRFVQNGRVTQYPDELAGQSPKLATGQPQGPATGEPLISPTGPSCKPNRNFSSGAPNAEGLSQGALQHVCWACGGRSAKKLTLCHIERFRPNEAYRPENFIILCDRCHREQPTRYQEKHRYWLSTRESKTEYYQRRKAVFIAAFALLRNEFGDLVVRVACEELLGYIKSIMDRYGHNSAGQSPGNWQANAEWGWFAEIHKWCVANKDKVALQIQRVKVR